MAKPLSPRSLRGDAQFDLAGIYEELQAMNEELGAFVGGVDEALGKFRAHMNRRLHVVNRFRYSAVASLAQADEIEYAVWDGETERRQHDRRVDLTRVAA